MFKKKKKLSCARAQTQLLLTNKMRWFWFPGFVPFKSDRTFGSYFTFYQLRLLSFLLDMFALFFPLFSLFE